MGYFLSSWDSPCYSWGRKLRLKDVFQCRDEGTELWIFCTPRYSFNPLCSVPELLQPLTSLNGTENQINLNLPVLAFCSVPSKVFTAVTAYTIVWFSCASPQYQEGNGTLQWQLLPCSLHGLETPSLSVRHLQVLGLLSSLREERQAGSKICGSALLWNVLAKTFPIMTNCRMRNGSTGLMTGSDNFFWHLSPYFLNNSRLKVTLLWVSSGTEVPWSLMLFWKCYPKPLRWEHLHSLLQLPFYFFWYCCSFSQQIFRK